MRLYIDLNAKEEADIHGWVNFYKQNPTAPVQRLVLDDRTQARVAQITAQFAAPIPPPNPGDPLARMRAAPSQLAIWKLATSEEVQAMNEIHGVTRVAQQLNFYSQGNPGNVSCRQTGSASYEFVRNEQWVPDVGGASDVLVAQNAEASGVPVIGPLSP